MVLDILHSTFVCFQQAIVSHCVDVVDNDNHANDNDDGDNADDDDGSDDGDDDGYRQALVDVVEQLLDQSVPNWQEDIDRQAISSG